MLKIYKNGKPEHPLVIEKDMWYIEHAYDGQDILNLVDVPNINSSAKYIEEEVRITDGRNRYTVKNIDDHGGYMNVKCMIDLDDWRSKFWESFRTTNSTLQQVFDKIKPSGWKLSGGEDITKKDTIESSEGKGLENVTAEAILTKVAEVYEVVFNYNAIEKIVYVIDPKKFVASGEYLTTELNLRTVGFVGSTTEIVTRLYPYGKKDDKGNPVTIKDVNGGKKYIDNNQYTDRVISAAWSDERYTVPKNLLAAAKKKLDELSFPVRSYECDVRNIDETMFMYKVITLIDRERKKRIEHRVVTYKEYPEDSNLDVVTLSAVQPKIELSMKEIRSEMREQISVQKQVSNDEALKVMDILTGKNGGHIKIDLEDGNPERIRVLHDVGDETVLGANGVYRKGQPFVTGCLFSTAIDIIPDTETGATIGVVQLPDAFKEKKIVTSIVLEKITAQNPFSVLQEFEKESSFDKESAKLTVTIRCSMLDTQEGVSIGPKEIRVSVIVIGGDDIWIM